MANREKMKQAWKEATSISESDLSEPEVESIANSAKLAKVDGIIISNTTIQ